MKNNENDGMERTKIEIDVVKHFSTLSTGSVVLVATFLEKLPKPIANYAVFFLRSSLGCFSIATLLSVIYLTTPWTDVQYKARLNYIMNRLCFTFCGVALIAGVFLLAVFAEISISH